MENTQIQNELHPPSPSNHQNIISSSKFSVSTERYRSYKAPKLPSISIDKPNTHADNHLSENDSDYFDFQLFPETSDLVKSFEFEDPSKTNDNQNSAQSNSMVNPVQFLSNDIKFGKYIHSRNHIEENKLKEHPHHDSLKTSMLNPNDIDHDYSTRELHLKIPSLLHRIQLLEKSVKARDKKLSSLNSELTMFKAKGDIYNTEKEDYTQKLQELALEFQNRIKNSENEFNRKVMELENLKIEKRKLAEHSQQKFQKLKEGYDYLKSTLREAERLMYDLENSTEKQELNKMKQLLETRNSEVQALSESLNKKEEIIENVKDSIRSLERENTLLQGKMNDNFDYSAFNQEIEDELQEKLMRQKLALTADANAKFEAQDQIIERVNFELEKSNRRLASIQNELLTKTEENVKLQAEVEILSKLKLRMAQDIEDQTRENEHNINFIKSEVESKAQEISNQNLQLSKLEGLLSLKDNEIDSCRRQVNDYDEHFMKLTREINQLKFDLSLKDAQINELEMAIESRENDAKLQHLVSIEDTEKHLKQQKEEYEGLLQKHQQAFRDLNLAMFKIKSEKETESIKCIELLDQLDRKDKKIEDLKESLQVLELEVFKKDQSYEVDVLKKAYKELTSMVAMSDEYYHENYPNQDPTFEAYNSSHVSEKRLRNFTTQNPSDFDSSGSYYFPVKDDPIDQAVDRFLKSKPKGSLPSIYRVEHGIYLIGGTNQNVKLVGTHLYVESMDNLVHFDDFLLNFASASFSVKS